MLNLGLVRDSEKAVCRGESQHKMTPRMSTPLCNPVARALLRSSLERVTTVDKLDTQLRSIESRTDARD